MVGKIAGLDAVRYKENVIGAAKMVGAVDKVGLTQNIVHRFTCHFSSFLL